MHPLYLRRLGNAWFGFGSGRCTGFIHSTGLFMSIIDYLAADQIMVGVAGSSKKQLIEQLAERAAELTGLCQRSLFEIVMRRERLGSTAIGNGIAIPHAVHQDLTRTMGIIAVLTSPLILTHKIANLSILFAL